MLQLSKQSPWVAAGKRVALGLSYWALENFVLGAEPHSSFVSLTPPEIKKHGISCRTSKQPASYTRTPRAPLTYHQYYNLVCRFVPTCLTWFNFPLQEETNEETNEKQNKTKQRHAYETACSSQIQKQGATFKL